MTRCSSGVPLTFETLIRPAKCDWTNDLHYPSGQLLLMDSSVAVVNRIVLDQSLDNGAMERGDDGDADDPAAVHFFVPLVSWSS